MNEASSSQVDCCSPRVCRGYHLSVIGGNTRGWQDSLDVLQASSLLSQEKIPSTGKERAGLACPWESLLTVDVTAVWPKTTPLPGRGEKP